MEFVFAILITFWESLRRREFQMLFRTQNPALRTYCAGTCFSTKTGGEAHHPPAGFRQEAPFAVKRVNYNFLSGEAENRPVYKGLEYIIRRK